MPLAFTVLDAEVDNYSYLLKCCVPFKGMGRGQSIFLTKGFVSLHASHLTICFQSFLWWPRRDQIDLSFAREGTLRKSSALIQVRRCGDHGIFGEVSSLDDRYGPLSGSTLFWANNLILNSVTGCFQDRELRVLLSTQGGWLRLKRLYHTVGPSPVPVLCSLLC